MWLNIVLEYTDLPGGRYIRQGSHSGEDFRENLLKSKYEYCLANNEKLIINFDGGYGYASSFLEEAFGGMVRQGYDAKDMIKRIVFVTEDEPELEKRCIKYIKEAQELKDAEDYFCYKTFIKK